MNQASKTEMAVPQVIALIERVQDVEQKASDFIAAPSGGGPLEDSVRRSYQRGCERYSAAPGFVKELGPAGQSLGRICRQYLEDESYSEPVSEAPFTGGQCEGVSYNIQYTRPDGTSSAVNGNGPIGVETEDITVSGCGGQTFTQYFITFGNGTRFSMGDDRDGTTCNKTGQAATIDSVIRNDGLPDDCGNPEEQFKPGPNPAPDPGPSFEPSRDPSFPDLPRFVDPTTYTDPVFGTPPVPSVGLPSVSVSIGEGGGGGSGIPTGPGVAGGSQDSGDGGEVSGQAPDGETLIGLKVELTAIPAFARQVENSTVPAYIGSVYVKMGWDGQLELAQEGQFVQSGDFFVAPIGATHWLVRAAIGYSVRVTPYYTETIQEV